MSTSIPDADVLSKDRSIYIINRSARFHSRSWDGESVIYDDFTGNTHFLDPFAAEVLVRLERALSLPALLEKLTESFIFDADEDVTARTEAALAELRGMELILTTS